MQRQNDPDASTSERSSFRATVFRQDGSTASVTVSDFGFDGCLLSSEVTFVHGERLNLYQSGQGCILMTLADYADGQARMMFLTECHV
jgi:hypothetical protein